MEIEIDPNNKQQLERLIRAGQTTDIAVTGNERGTLTARVHGLKDHDRARPQNQTQTHGK